jgi:hypothetical protein
VQFGGRFTAVDGQPRRVGVGRDQRDHRPGVLLHLVGAAGVAVVVRELDRVRRRVGGRVAGGVPAAVGQLVVLVR